MAEPHPRIWLEPEPESDPSNGRQWCQENVWGDDATEYVLASSVAAVKSENERLKRALTWIKEHPAESNAVVWDVAESALSNGGSNG